jgi:septum formation protein
VARRTIFLASSSPRRLELLKQSGHSVIVVPADVEEVIPDYFTVGETTLFNAKQKASSIAIHRPTSLVLGVDTLVTIDRQILGKPRDLDEAFAMLTQLSGREHEVYSGVWLTERAREKSWGFIEVSRVRFRALSPKEIHQYLKRIQPLDKAGAYAAQDDKMSVIESIQGSITNVVGLPMEKLAEALEAF